MTRIITPPYNKILGSSSSLRRRFMRSNGTSLVGFLLRRRPPPPPIWAQVEAGGTTTTKDDDDDDQQQHLVDLLKSPATAKMKKKTSSSPLLLFPWHHDNDLPTRIVQRKENFRGGGGGILFNYDAYNWGVATVTGGFYFHHIPFFGLFGNQWRNELADSCSWAFVQGVCGILSNVYDVPVDPYGGCEDDNDDEITISFFYNNEKTEEKSVEKTGINEEEEEESKKKITSADDDGDNNNNNNNDNSQQHLLLEKKLANLFRDAHKSGGGGGGGDQQQIQVCLESTPLSSDLLSLHSIPALSRNLAETHPRLVKEISDDRSNGGTKFGSGYMDLVLKETGKIETTIFADVLINCYERFWVKDLQTGTIIQGNGDNKFREVTHVVRLERVSTYEPQKGRSLGNWIITDIDDLLDGNRWFTPTVPYWWQAG